MVPGGGGGGDCVGVLRQTTMGGGVVGLVRGVGALGMAAMGVLDGEGVAIAWGQSGSSEHRANGLWLVQQCGAGGSLTQTKTSP